VNSNANICPVEEISDLHLHLLVQGLSSFQYDWKHLVQ
jgi:hypothetical protein